MKCKKYILCCILTAFAVLFAACGSNTADTPSEPRGTGNTQSDTYVSSDDSSFESASSSDLSDSSTPAESENTGTAASALNSSSKAVAAVSSAAAHTHSWNRKTVAATCTQQGYTLKTCSCGKTEKESYVKALGHSWSAWTTVKAATQAENGRQERSCTRCKTVEAKTLNKLSAPVGDMQKAVLRLVNEERAKAGLPALSYYNAAQSAADTRVQEIITSFSHTRPNGTACFAALDALGIKYSTAGENIAAGQTTPEQVIQSWMASDGHRENILSPDYNAIAIGYKDNHWVQLFLAVK